MKLAKRLMMSLAQAGGADPYWANTVLCINPAGANDSTTFVDSTGRQSVSALGKARIRNDLGFPSIYLDGGATGPGIQIASSSDFAFPGDFTIEVFTYPTSWDANDAIFCFIAAGLLQVGRYGSESKIGLARKDVAWDIIGASGSLPATGQMHYVALRRSGSTISLRANGDLIGSVTNSTSFSAAQLFIGRTDNGSYYFHNAHIRGVRVTKGVARDTSLVPTLPFPTS